MALCWSYLSGQRMQGHVSLFIASAYCNSIVLHMSLDRSRGMERSFVGIIRPSATANKLVTQRLMEWDVIDDNLFLELCVHLYAL